MWRTFFIAFGLMAMIIGFECLLIESADFCRFGQARSFLNPNGVATISTRGWQPKEWFPWVALSTGGITVLYAFTLPQRWARAGE